MIHYVAHSKKNTVLVGNKKELTQQLVKPFKWGILFGTLFLLQQQLGASCIYGQQLQVETERVGNLLWWTTQSEAENETFLIQRSLNGLDFVTIGSISGAGNSYTEQTYRYWDVDAEAMRVWYRIVEMDYNGRGTASPTVIANRITPSNFLLTQMEQSTVQDWFRCTLDSKVAGRGSFTIRDYYGELITYGDMHVNYGQNHLTVEMGTIPAGVYQITFEIGLETEQVWVEKLQASGERLRVARM